MRRFTEKFLIPYIATSGYRRLCEIGSQGGSNIDRLLQLESVEITTIDPCIDMNLEDKYRDNPHMHVLKGLSLNMLPKLDGAFDCIMIDGDHNWYSVYHELQLVHPAEAARQEWYDSLPRCSLALCQAGHVLRPEQCAH